MRDIVAKYFRVVGKLRGKMTFLKKINKSITEILCTQMNRSFINGILTSANAYMLMK